MAYLSVPKIFRHLTFLHLSSPFIVDNCSHISNLSFAITYLLCISRNSSLPAPLSCIRSMSSACSRCLYRCIPCSYLAHLFRIVLFLTFIQSSLYGSGSGIQAITLYILVPPCPSECLSHSRYLYFFSFQYPASPNFK